MTDHKMIDRIWAQMDKLEGKVEEGFSNVHVKLDKVLESKNMARGAIIVVSGISSIVITLIFQIISLYLKYK